MGLFDFLKGGKKAEATTSTKSPSQVLREAGLDPSTLKFGFGSDGTVTISGVAVSDSERQRIVNLVSEIPGVTSVNNQIDLAAVGAESSSTDSMDFSGGSDPEPVTVTGTKEYTVVSGDTLWKISKEHYGEGGKYMKIFEANRDILDDPDKIQVGQVLKLPD